jgi:hypothetical protein
MHAVHKVAVIGRTPIAASLQALPGHQRWLKSWAMGLVYAKWVQTYGLVSAEGAACCSLLLATRGLRTRRNSHERRTMLRERLRCFSSKPLRKRST